MTRRLPETDDKDRLSQQLDRELEQTFPASDPLKITRFTVATRGNTRPPRTKKEARASCSRT